MASDSESIMMHLLAGCISLFHSVVMNVRNSIRNIDDTYIRRRPTTHGNTAATRASIKALFAECTYYRPIAGCRVVVRADGHRGGGHRVRQRAGHRAAVLPLRHGPRLLRAHTQTLVPVRAQGLSLPNGAGRSALARRRRAACLAADVTPCLAADVTQRLVADVTTADVRGDDA